MMFPTGAVSYNANLTFLCNTCTYAVIPTYLVLVEVTPRTSEVFFLLSLSDPNFFFFPCGTFADKEREVLYRRLPIKL